MTRESIDTVSEVIYHLYEASDCLQRSGLWNFPNPLNPLVTQLHPFFAKNVAKELNMIQHLDGLSLTLNSTNFDKI